MEVVRGGFHDVVEEGKKGRRDCDNDEESLVLCKIIMLYFEASQKDNNKPI